MIINTPRLTICEAGRGDLPEIMRIENHPENRDFIWQGSHEEHMREIEEEDSLLLTLRSEEGLIGYILARVNTHSDIFELRRIAVTRKGSGYGREAILALMDYAFNYLAANRFWLDLYTYNEVGISLYRSLGMKHEGTLRHVDKSPQGEYLDMMIFSLLRDEYFSQSRKAL